MWYEIVIEIDKKESDVFSEIDANPVHQKEKDDRGINGCVSGLYLISLVNKYSWDKNVFCAKNIDIKFMKAVYPGEVILLYISVKVVNCKRLVRFHIQKEMEMICKGKIKQILWLEAK